jgi:hypothetical protein
MILAKMRRVIECAAIVIPGLAFGGLAFSDSICQNIEEYECGDRYPHGNVLRFPEGRMP